MANKNKDDDLLQVVEQKNTSPAAVTTPTLNYKNYTATPLTGLQNYSAIDMPGLESYSALAAPELQDYAYKYLEYQDFNDEYADYIKNAVAAMQNRQPFSYDYTQDESYKQYADAYKRNGQLAMEDTLAKLASRTGGLASSYASAASQQAYNAYMQELANKIPELRELAYNKYQDDIANERADLATYMDLSNQAYDRYSKDRDLAYNENVLMNEYGYANTQNQNNLKIQDWQNRQSVENGNVDIRNNAAIQNWQNQQNISNANIDAANALIKYNNQLLNSSNEANTKLYNSAQEALYNQQMAEYDASQNYWKKLDDLVIGNKTSGSGERAQIYVDGLGWLSSKELDQYIKDDRISEESRGNVIYYKAIKQGSR